MQAEAAFAAAIATGDQQAIAAAERAVEDGRQKLREATLARAIAPDQEVMAAVSPAMPPDQEKAAPMVTSSTQATYIDTDGDRMEFKQANSGLQ